MAGSIASRVAPAAAAHRGGRAAGLTILCALLFLTFLDNTIVSVALGSVQADLQAGVSALQWVVGAYALTFAGAMLACGMIGDEVRALEGHAGRRRGVLPWLGAVRAGPDCRAAHRRAGNHGPRRGRQ